MKRRDTQLGNKLLAIAAREEERKRRRGEVEEWEAGGRDEGWRSTKQREKMEDVHLYTAHIV